MNMVSLTFFCLLFLHRKLLIQSNFCGRLILRSKSCETRVLIHAKEDYVRFRKPQQSYYYCFIENTLPTKKKFKKK